MYRSYIIATRGGKNKASWRTADVTQRAIIFHGTQWSTDKPIVAKFNTGEFYQNF